MAGITVHESSRVIVKRSRAMSRGMTRLPYGDNLEWHNGKLRVRVVVPPQLRAAVGRAKFTKNLDTANYQDAKAASRPWIAKFQAEIDAAARPRIPWFDPAAMVAELDDRAAIAARFAALVAAGDIIMPTKDDIARIKREERGDSGATNAKPADAAEVIAFDSLIERWRVEKGKGIDSVKSMQRCMGRLAAFLADGDTSRLTKDNLDDYLRRSDAGRVSLADLNRFLDGSLIAAKTAGKIRSPTIHDYVFQIRALLGFASRKHGIPNPAADWRYEGSRVKAEKDMLDDADRALLLREASASADPFIRWGTLLAAYTGARSEELAECDVRDIMQMGEHWVIRIREDHKLPGEKLKTVPSKRDIPLHRAIIDAGFLGYVQALPAAGSLFPHLRIYNGRRRKAATNIIGRWMRALGFGGRKTFHCWRQTVRTQLEDAGVSSDRARYIVGHAADDIDAKVYLKHPIPKLAAAIALIEPPLLRAE